MQVIFFGVLSLVLLGGEGSLALPEENKLQCSDNGEPLLERSGLGLEDPISSSYLGAQVLLEREELDEPANCSKNCCALPRCNLAVLQAGRCYLIDCIFEGKNVCRLVPRDGAICYLKGDKAMQPNMEDFCLPQMKIGPCRAAIPRWYYDAKTKSCTEFLFGGCEGNLNNHETEERCKEICSVFISDEKSNEIVSANKRMAETSSFQEFCALKPDTGPCRAAFPRWYYDTEKKMCSKFVFGGCMGNKNNHLSEEACMDKCSGMLEPEKIKSDKNVNFQEYCAAPSDTGPCRAAFPRWFYNISAHTCAQFIYGGCRGNKNNYLSEKICKEHCVAHPDAEEGYDPLHTVTHHSTTAVALAVLLAVMAAILLGAMVVVFVKVTRRNHQESSLATIWSPIDDKECLMKNAYTL